MAAAVGAGQPGTLPPNTGSNIRFPAGRGAKYLSQYPLLSNTISPGSLRRAPDPIVTSNLQPPPALLDARADIHLLAGRPRLLHSEARNQKTEYCVAENLRVCPCAHLWTRPAHKKRRSKESEAVHVARRRVHTS